MTLLEQIEKQAEVLDFITFLQQRAGILESAERNSLRKHAAFGSWKHRGIDAVEYQQKIH